MVKFQRFHPGVGLMLKIGGRRFGFRPRHPDDRVKFKRFYWGKFNG